MKRILSLLILFVALGVSNANAQYDNRDTRNQKTTRVFEPGVFQDEGGEYRWARVETRVWVPERRTTGIFGIGARTIPGHYEVINTRREKVYTRDRNNQSGEYKKSGKKHPHGMPPGQRKKMQGNGHDNDRWDNEDDNKKGNKGNKHKNHDNHDNHDNHNDDRD